MDASVNASYMGVGAKVGASYSKENSKNFEVSSAIKKTGDGKLTVNCKQGTYTY